MDAYHFRLALLDPDGQLIAWTVRMSYVDALILSREMQHFGQLHDVRPTNRSLNHWWATCERHGELLTRAGSLPTRLVDHERRAASGL